MPSTLGNTMCNAVLENIHQVLGNLVRNFIISTQTYIDEDDLWTGILSSPAFVVILKINRQKGYIPGRLIFGRDMILPVKHRVNW